MGEGSPMLQQVTTFRCAFLLALAVAACGTPEVGQRNASPAGEARDSAEPLPPGVHRFVIVPTESKVSYVADEELFALAFTKFGLPAGWAKVVGSTQAIEGQFQLDTARPVTWLGDNQFTVRMDTFTTDRSMRDNWIRTNGPRFNDYPVATFKATAIDASEPYSPGSELTFNLRGTLRVREIDRPTSFAVRANLSADTLKGTATTRLPMSSFGIETITFLDTLTVADEIGLEVHFTARAAPENRPPNQ
jgi:polyisoprenoid-binding protein YceI